MAITGLEWHRFWISYIALGGNCTPGEVRAYLDGVSGWSPVEHDVAAQALNERCADLGLGCPVAYTTDLLTDQQDL